MGFLSGIGSIFGGGDAKKAAKIQAEAIREQTAATVRQAGLAAEQAANQIRNTMLEEQATQYAKTILGRPMEQVNVRLAPASQAQTTDRTGRQVSTRDTYMSKGGWFA
ncbi:scaffolding protein [Stenotrophomonas phage StenM_174]|uniref:Uncharacterized protein n=3 Tax=Ponderosavirus TaxID=3424921 RepID=A0AAE7WM41_9CAUD|nr:hypothetical protein CPT_Ponderosa_034 [Stenotrophomonas phage Ponderosa]QYW01983.1 hypothetical protein CPT_Pepon033 [Stenotrophomonas phage Pepon]WPK42341.1 scaffolding protein [Stenotrophomonas phage StenM_174]